MGFRRGVFIAGILALLLIYFAIGVYAAEEQATSETRTLKKFLQIAMQPVGGTMYIWGGGWNEEDTAAGAEALSFGVSQNWKEFFDKQDKYYDTKKTAYMIHSGLDCTGFLGWALFNLIPNETGYVMKSGVVVKTLAGYGWGDWRPKSKIDAHIAGDIMGMDGHVWISLGTCGDGSVLILQSSPPGVSLYGTQKGRKKSIAVELAEQYIQKYYPSWYGKYPDCKRGASYLTGYDMFRWDGGFLPDPDGYRNMGPEEILKDLFKDSVHPDN